LKHSGQFHLQAGSFNGNSFSENVRFRLSTGRVEPSKAGRTFADLMRTFSDVHRDIQWEISMRLSSPISEECSERSKTQVFNIDSPFS
jgi:hypothetical protein